MYDTREQTRVRRLVDEFEHGTLHAGHTGVHITGRNQAAALGLYIARRESSKIPKK